MAYTKTTWTSGTAITTSLLNHLESQYAEAKSLVDNHNHDSRYFTESEMNSGFWHAGNDGSGSGCDADTLGGHEASYFAGVGVPSGLIIMFSGSTPSGWYDCNGANGTPDLRDRFIVGAGNSYAVGNSGGSVSITPTATVTIATHALTLSEIPTHTHQYYDRRREIKYSYTLVYSSAYYGYDSRYARDHSTDLYTGYAGGGQAHGHPGSTFAGSSQENRPPYYALKFIMKS